MQVNNPILRTLYSSHTIATNNELILVYLTSLVFVSIAPAMRRTMHTRLGYNSTKDATTCGGVGAGGGRFAIFPMSGVNGSSVDVSAVHDATADFFGQCWWEQHVSFVSSVLTFYLISRFLFMWLFSYHAICLVAVRARLFAALTSLKRSQTERMPWLNTMSNLETLDGWLKIRHAVRDLLSPQELLLTSLYIGIAIITQVVIALVLLTTQFGLTQTTVMR